MLRANKVIFKFNYPNKIRRVKSHAVILIQIQLKLYLIYMKIIYFHDTYMIINILSCPRLRKFN